MGPRLAVIGRLTLPGGSSEAEWDHHAFLYSPEYSLAVVPVESYGRGATDGAIAIAVDPEGGLTEILYAATGFLHVRREVYETISKLRHDLNGAARDGSYTPDMEKVPTTV